MSNKKVNNKVQGPTSFTTISALLCSWFGSDLMKSLSNPVLNRIFAVVMVAMGLQIFIK